MVSQLEDVLVERKAQYEIAGAPPIRMKVRARADAAANSGTSVRFEIMNAFRTFLDEESGQDVVEYGLLIATIAIVVLAAVGLFGSQIAGWFNTLAGRITTA